MKFRANTWKVICRSQDGMISQARSFSFLVSIPSLSSNLSSSPTTSQTQVSSILLPLSPGPFHHHRSPGCRQQPLTCLLAPRLAFPRPVFTHILRDLSELWIWSCHPSFEILCNAFRFKSITTLWHVQQGPLGPGLCLTPVSNASPLCSVIQPCWTSSCLLNKLCSLCPLFGFKK